MLLVALVGAFAPLEAAPLPNAGHHLIYLHGKIVQEQQDRRPEHPEHGHYELDAIAGAFRENGFTVTADVRPQERGVGESADEVVRKVRQLIDAGVPENRITVVGASMGSWIALLASVRLAEPEIRFVLLGPCLSANVAAVTAEEGRSPKGRLLVIRDASDFPDSDCPPWSGDGRATPGLSAEEIVIDTGLGHGFLYRPMPEWLDPLLSRVTRSTCAE